jgi:hypothetical protein
MMMSASLPGASEPALAIKTQGFCAVHGGIAQHIAGRERGWYACGRRRPRIARRAWRKPPIHGVWRKPLIEDYLVHERALQIHADAHLDEEVCRHRALDIDAQGWLHTQALQLQDGRHAVPHVHLDREAALKN